jgi:hypothetical protein
MEETGGSYWAVVLLTMMVDRIADFKADLNMILQCARIICKYLKLNEGYLINMWLNSFPPALI